ncbi:MAG: hypothetical protein D6729_01365 [Deltaproteobacteria bacterium]|nr:MAG: hypothetical protein D6729_01365 [Deltaproteobacteria bacterium]
MRVGCPSCSTQYRLPDEKFKPGVKVRCKRCGLVFTPGAVQAEVKAPAERPAVPLGEQADPPPSTAAPSPEEAARELEALGSDWGSGQVADIDQIMAAIHGEIETPSPAPSDAGGQVSGTATTDTSSGAVVQDDPLLALEDAPDAYDTALAVAEPLGAGRGGRGDEAEQDLAGRIVPLGEDLFADLGLEEGPSGDAGDVGTGLAEELDDPFADLDLEAPSASRAGASAIRAQDGLGGPVSSATAAPVRGSGWLLRTQGDEVHRFDGLAAVRAWLAAHPGVAAELSSDGVTWRRPEVVLGLSPEDLMDLRGTVRPPVSPLVRKTTTAVRGDALKVEATAGPLWTAAFVLSTLVLLGSALLTVHVLGWADLSGVLPLRTLGLEPPAEASAGAAPAGKRAGPRAAPARPEEDFAEIVAQARRALAEDRLIDAAMAYERALALRPAPEAFDALAKTYERLGAPERAEAVRQRAAASRDSGAQSE